MAGGGGDFGPAPQGSVTPDRSSNLFEQVYLGKWEKCPPPPPPPRVVIQIKQNDGYGEPGSALPI